jgi:cytochrome c-type biogenesis protein CcmF
VVALARNAIPARLQATTLAVQGSVNLCIHLLHPRNLQPLLSPQPGAVRGQDLNPILQDPGLAIHPPLLYVGYVGFSISFSFAMAALIEGRIDAVWARAVRPWTLLAWCFLTVASRWARTGPTTSSVGWLVVLGPVENASLMPWLAAPLSCTPPS